MALVVVQCRLAAACKELVVGSSKLITAFRYGQMQRLVVVGAVVTAALLLLLILMHQLRLLVQAMPGQRQLQLLPGAAIATIRLIVVQLHILYAQHDQYKAGELKYETD